MRQFKTTPLDVQEGEVKAGCREAGIVAESATVVALELGFDSKYAEIDGLMSDNDSEHPGNPLPGIMVSANERTLDTNHDKKDQWTFIRFPAYRGWSVFATYCGRYTAHVVLINDTVYD